MNLSSVTKPVLKKSTVYQVLLVSIFLFSFISKIWNIAEPDSYYFDEIYYGFTAEQYAQGNIKAWVWDYTPPEGFAYTWDHPPTGKLIMSFFVKLFGVNSSSRRLAPLIAGSLLPLAVYQLVKTLFPGKEILALLASFITACDGLVLSLSRIALTDEVLTLFICLTLLFLWRKQYIFSAIFFGLSISTKWTGIFLFPIICLTIISYQSWNRPLLITSIKKIISMGLFFLVIGTIVYLISYTPLFVNYGFQKFIDLHKQMWWYHTNLKATHPFQSAAYLWPINWRPVWFWVEYGDKLTANIYAMLNPAIAWGGLLTILLTIYSAIKDKSLILLYILSAYFVFWAPWIASPRIMFLYHYLPSVPFLIISLAFILEKLLLSKQDLIRLSGIFYLSLIFACFIFFYPYWTGVPVVNEVIDKFRWLKTWGP